MPLPFQSSGGTTQGERFSGKLTVRNLGDEGEFDCAIEIDGQVFHSGGAESYLELTFDYVRGNLENPTTYGESH